MFCNHCGCPLEPGAAFCLQCGQAVAAPVPGDGAPAAARACTLTLTRERQWFAVNPDVKCIVDDQSEYRIENGGALRIPLTPGEHSLVFRCGIRNKALTLTVRQDMALHLKWKRLTGGLTVRETAE